MTEIISVVRSGPDWAVKHGAEYLGLARSRDQALQAARSLVQWMESRGRSACLEEAEPRGLASHGSNDPAIRTRHAFYPA